MALVAVLAFTFGNNLAANQQVGQANVKLAQSLPYDPPRPPEPPSLNRGSGGSGSSPIPGCNKPNACNYNPNATGVLPMTCEYAFYAESLGGADIPTITQHAEARNGAGTARAPIGDNNGKVTINIIRYSETNKPPITRSQMSKSPVGVFEKHTLAQSTIVGSNACTRSNQIEAEKKANANKAKLAPVQNQVVPAKR